MNRLTNKFLFELKNYEREYSFSREHILDMIKNPDPDSNFANATRVIRMLPEGFVFFPLKILGYNAMLSYLEKKDRVIGHIAYQQHKTSEGLDWRIFHHWVSPDNRGNGIGTEQAKNFLEIARKRKISRVRLSGKGNEKVNKLVEKLYEEHPEFRNAINLETHWVTF